MRTQAEKYGGYVRIYCMIVESKQYFPGTPEAMATRQEYRSPYQGTAPLGYRCIGVCGYYDKPRKKYESEGI